MDSKEKWVSVKGYEGIYWVSDFGNVKNNKGLMLSQGVNKDGYFTVKLSKNGQKKLTVHQLVAIAFLNHTPSGITVVINHKDLNKLNNKLNNLELVTNRENCNHKHLKSSSEYTGVSWHPSCKKWDARIHADGVGIRLGMFNTELEAHKAYQSKLKEVNASIKFTSAQWLSKIPLSKKPIIYDPDGWDRLNYEYSFNEELVTESEFNRRLSMSTIIYKTL